MQLALLSNNVLFPLPPINDCSQVGLAIKALLFVHLADTRDRRQSPNFPPDEILLLIQLLRLLLEQQLCLG